MAKIYNSGKELADDLQNKLQKASEKHLYTLTNEFMKDSNDLIPKEDGFLRLSQQKDSEPKKGLIKMSAPQSKYLYYAPDDWNWTTAGTGPMWWHKNKKENNKKYLKMVGDDIFKSLKK